MYIPNSFKEERKEVLFELIKNNSFGILTSNTSNGLVATHLPFMIDTNKGENGTLIAHFARANPHWKNIDNEQDSLVIFQGPHCYISPSWYEENDTVPTWNYAAVHAYGKLKLIHEPKELKPMLEELVNKYESIKEEPWNISEAEGAMENLIKAIVGFEIKINKIEGNYKFNQNHPVQNQTNVINALSNSTNQVENQVACIMARNLNAK